jgi:3'-phosphoadenosine 5'-phosphosulfate sulfotransferase (PAPS reductase)/FAD synthetase
MLWWPLQNAMLNDGITTVYRGSKAQDHRVGVPDGFIQGGITYRSPLWDWSDDQVFSYIDAQGAELAEHYGSVNASMDCWNCTAYLNDQNAAAKLQWTRARYPDLWPELSHRLRRVADTISAETQRVQGALGMAKFDKSVEHVDP